MPIKTLFRNRTALFSSQSLPLSPQRFLGLLLVALSVGSALLAMAFFYEFILQANELGNILADLPYIRPQSLTAMQLQWTGSPFALTATSCAVTQPLWMAARQIRQGGAQSFQENGGSISSRLLRLMAALFFCICALLALFYAAHLLLGLVIILRATHVAFSGFLLKFDHTHEVYFWLPLTLFLGFSLLAALTWDVKKQMMLART
jgi:hypothetical protein